MIILENRKRQRCVESSGRKLQRGYFRSFCDSLEESSADAMGSNKRHKCCVTSMNEDICDEGTINSRRLSIDHDSIVLFAGLFDACGGDDDYEILPPTHDHIDGDESDKENDEKIVVVRKDIVRIRRPKRQACLGCGDVHKPWKASFAKCRNVCGRSICGKCFERECRSKGSSTTWCCLFCSSKKKKI